MGKLIIEVAIAAVATTGIVVLILWSLMWASTNGYLP